MNSARAIALLALAAPAAAFAQTSYSQATVLGPPPVVLSADAQACWDRHDTLETRKAYLDQEKREVDREGAAIAREGAQLQATDTAAVAAHNRRVASHNRRVADMNLAAAMHNDSAANMVAYCNLRAYRWRDDAYVSSLR